MTKFLPLSRKKFLVWLLYLHVASNSISRGYYEQTQVKDYLRERLYHWEDLLTELKGEYPAYQEKATLPMEKIQHRDAIMDTLVVYFRARATGFCFIRPDEFAYACNATFALLQWMEEDDYEIKQLVELRVELTISYNIFKDRAIGVGKQVELVDQTGFYNHNKSRSYYLVNESMEMLDQFFG